MTALDPEENTLYARADQLHPLAWQELARRSAAETAEAAAARWDGNAFLLDLLGRGLRVAPAERSVTFLAEPTQTVSYQRGLVAVTWLARALPVDPRGDWVTFRELPGGDGFFRGPHALNTAALESRFGAQPQTLAAAAAALGGRVCSGGDAAVEVPALPRLPVRVLLWAASDEFPPAANLLTDPRAALHLPLDVLWALTNLLIADLTRSAP